MLYLKSFVLSCLGFGENENKQLTILFGGIFLLFFGVIPLSFLGQQHKTQLLAASTNSSYLAFRKCFCLPIRWWSLATQNTAIPVGIALLFGSMPIY